MVSASFLGFLSCFGNWIYNGCQVDRFLIAYPPLLITFAVWMKIFFYAKNKIPDIPLYVRIVNSNGDVIHSGSDGNDDADGDP